MTLTAIRCTAVVLINGVMVRVAEEPSITEALDGFATVTEFELIDRPDPIPAEDDVVEVWRVNLDDETYIPLFGGYLLGRDAESEPHGLVFRAIDELSKFNAIRTTSDLALTGMTDGEAWQAVATVCGVTFDPADIQDTGYVLGERAPVYWKVGTSGASVIQELDRVFGAKTMTVLNNRVVRFAYDRVASSANIQKTYTKGESADFWKNHKATGDSDQVQSMWEVTGASVPCGDENSCSCVVWAKSIGANPKKGKKLQAVPTGTFQSDLIQDEAIARAISRRLMRWYNRIPVIISAEVQTDANIHPGSVIGIEDPTYGIGDATVKPYTVLTCDKRGSLMTVSAVGGTAGPTGTTTSGVEQRCNNTNLDIDWEGDWGLPTIGLPPFGDFAGFGGFDFDLDWTVEGGTTGGGTPLPGEPFAVTWTNGEENAPGEAWDISTNSLFGRDGENTVAYTIETIPERSPGVAKAYRAEWDFQATADGAVEIWGEDSVTGLLHFWFPYFPPSQAVEIHFMTGCAYEGTCIGDEQDFGPFTPDAVTHAVVEWDPDALSYTVTVGATTVVLNAASDNVENPIRFSAIQGSVPGTSTNILDFTITVLE